MATKEIPYGLSDYARLALENYYYVDKTHFIPLIEKAASFFFLPAFRQEPHAEYA